MFSFKSAESSGSISHLEGTVKAMGMAQASSLKHRFIKEKDSCRKIISPDALVVWGQEAVYGGMQQQEPQDQLGALERFKKRRTEGA
jgi:hypothetical protein